AKKAFELFGGEVVVMNDQPDGYNINTKCGSTHPEQLIEKVLELKADAGFAFDGDADRCIGVNHLGELVTGDDVLYLVGKYLKKNNKLKNNLVVTTVMANLGLFRALEREGIDYRSTQVGDKYVFEVLGQEDGVIGGEQSGHIIFKDIAHTGDGVLTALKLVEIMVHENKSLKELTNGLVIYPQTLKNLKVKDKQNVLEDASINQFIAEVETRLNKDGRILVRPSGTEPLIRVMVEAKDQVTCDSIVDEVIDYIVQRGY
ncbi:MAG: phosphoglucosamine mutase, partial [Erysipelothrix sp.]|nr:phosphoglucosamine mutase [Erysipelothrix sp.]